ncbi:uncharacterized protein LOC131154294 [Malania oleifera]|uniref:uncharacterized protein LOC131154294 n=1 Tax=Malania oleifera TaxID=397392 RepID=UPI0025ADA296|nr:uncharacterized protein LOC131154294 [Malania oleifera]
MEEVDLVRPDHDVKGIEETEAEQLLPRDSPDAYDIFGDPLVHPRVGCEYQAEIPSIILESEHFHLLMNSIDTKVMEDSSHSSLMGLPIPIMWVVDEACNIKNEGAGTFCNPYKAVSVNGFVESKCRNKGQINPTNKNSKHKVETFDPGLHCEKEIESMSLDSTIENSNLDQIYKSKSCCPLPGSLGGSWNDIEMDSFVLGLYIFGKNLVQVKKFMECKEMGDILSFYYGKFHKSDRHCRWSDCRKMRSRKCIIGQRIFTGWRQQKLLSRVLPHVSKEFQDTLLEVSKAFAVGRISLEEYVFSLRNTVGIHVLIEAIGIGKGKKDLTGLAMEPLDANQVFPIRPEIPNGKDCSSLTSGDIIKFLTGDFRLSKAKSNDLFWEAVWPRLLARGWHSEQPKNQCYAGSKQWLVFLMPGVKKFSRRKLVKGDHYFDSVSDVLTKVASEPKLLDLENEEAKSSSCKEGAWLSEVKSEPDDVLVHKHQCYLKPRASASSSNFVKFTIVDTSLVNGERSSKVRELRSLPIETRSTSDQTSSGETEADSSADSLDEPEFADRSLNDKKCTNNCSRAKGISDGSGSNTRKLINCSGAPKKLQEYHQDQNTNASDDKHSRRVIKHQFSRRVKPGHSDDPAPLMKRQRLATCMKAEANLTMQTCIVGPDSKQEDPHRVLDTPEARKKVVSSAVPSALFISSAKGSPEGESCEGIPNGSCDGMEMSCMKNEKFQHWPLIDLNLPQVPSESDRGEPSVMEVDKDQANLDANGLCLSVDTNEHVDDVKALETTPLNVDIGGQHPVMNPRRQSTRSRPLTTRALEALASGFLNIRQSRKRTEVQRHENLILRPSRRARSRVPIATRFGNTSSVIVNSKEDGCNGNTKMVGKSLAPTERKLAHELLGISKASYYHGVLGVNDS